MTIIKAASRHDMSALIQVRKCLETGQSCRVEFNTYEVGKPASVDFTPADLKAVYYRITCAI